MVLVKPLGCFFFVCDNGLFLFKDSFCPVVTIFWGCPSYMSLYVTMYFELFLKKINFSTSNRLTFFLLLFFSYCGFCFLKLAAIITSYMPSIHVSVLANRGFSLLLIHALSSTFMNRCNSDFNH